MLRRVLLVSVLCGAPVLAAAAERAGTSAGAQEMAARDLARLAASHGKLLIVDVREPAEFAKGTIPGAINVPLSRLAARLPGIPKDTALVFT